ncbi:hypothetical protein P7H20_04710 [Paenibacillus larvae]|nr:hypothetical protein [Paenibacillus larvae]MDT2274318.1 hypothetical protein [Paenibacillus larvae]
MTRVHGMAEGSAKSDAKVTRIVWHGLAGEFTHKFGLDPGFLG